MIVKQDSEPPTLGARYEPDNKTVSRVSIELGSRWTARITSMAAVPVDEFIASMKKR